jgi:xanthine dehydrogenase large subunit
MMATGKRHDFVVDYQVGFHPSGRVLAVQGDWHARCGMSADLSGPVTDRALFHADNAYFFPDVELRSHPWRTHTVSNTAFRGFGGPQGVIAAERIIEEIAYATGQDTLAVHKANLYGTASSHPITKPSKTRSCPASSRRSRQAATMRTVVAPCSTGTRGEASSAGALR